MLFQGPLPTVSPSACSRTPQENPRHLITHSRAQGSLRLVTLTKNTADPYITEPGVLTIHPGRVSF